MMLQPIFELSGESTGESGIDFEKCEQASCGLGTLEEISGWDLGRRRSSGRPGGIWAGHGRDVGGRTNLADDFPIANG